MRDVFYKKLIQNSPIGCAYYELIFNEDNLISDYKVLEVNDTFERLIGLNCADKIGKTNSEILQTINGEQFDWINFYGDIAINGGSKEFEYFSQRLQHWYRVMVYSHKQNYFTTTFIDISKEKEHIAILENFFEVDLNLLCIASREGNFIKLNNSWEGVIGYSIKELIGRNILDFIHPEDIQATLDIMAKYNAGIRGGMGFTNRYRHKDGSYRFIEWNFHLKGNFYYAAAQDITERKQSEDELRNINKKLESFSYTIAHDLKEPVRSIQTFTEFIQEDYVEILDETGKDYFNRISKATKKIGLMINDLLLLSQVGRKDMKFEKFNIENLVMNIVNLLEQTINSSNTEIKIIDLPEIYCQSTWISAVFQNLITNSIKYNDKELKKIEISCRELNNYYEFSIKDNGQGIPEEQYEKIFGLFRKAHQNKNIEGSGAGLAIVKSVIEEHRGNIWVNWSKIGEGTVMKFTINKILKNK